MSSVINKEEVMQTIRPKFPLKKDIPSDFIPDDPRFGSGPSLIPQSFISSLSMTQPYFLGTSHRKPAVVDVIKQIQEGLREYFQLSSDWAVLIFNGGASLVFDMLASGMTQKGSHHFTCGEFSQKWKRSHQKVPWIKVSETVAEMGKTSIPDATEHGEADLICLTLNETSTGVRLPSLPVKESWGKKTLVAIDGTSGLGQLPLDFTRCDIVFFSPQKVFASEGGTSVVLLSPQAQERIKEREQYFQSHPEIYIPEYFQWDEHLNVSKKHQTLNTPSLSSLWFLNQQTKWLNSIGLNKILEEAQLKADFVYQWAEQHPHLSCFVKEKNFRSWCVATIDVDERFSVSELTQYCEEQKLILGIESYRKLNRNQLRIAFFPQVTLENLKKLTQLIDYLIKFF
jgi:phosphoserine aminotransferase